VRLFAASLFVVSSLSWWQAGLGAQPPAAVLVSARTWVDTKVVSAGTPARLWVTIENTTASPVIVRFDDFSMPGLSRGRCWSSDGKGPACEAGSGTAAVSPHTVAAQNSLTLWSEITRNPDELGDGGSVVLTGSFRWSADPATPGTSLTVATAPVELSSTMWSKTPRAVTLREWLAPIVVAVFGPVVAFLTYRYQQHRTERQAIWTQMMEKVTHDAEKHLLPVSAAAFSFVKAAKSWRKTRSHTDQSDLLFRLIMLNYRVAHMADTIGGFYFRLQSAEYLAGACWHAFKERQRIVLDRQEPLERTFLSLTLQMTGGALAAKRTDTWIGGTQFSADVKAVESGLAAFVDRQEFDLYEIPVLELFQQVIDVEVNRAFSKWYGHEPPVDRMELWRLHELLEAQPQDIRDTDAHKGLMQQFDAYLNDTERLWQQLWERR
jgi:hypothetical protein